MKDPMAIAEQFAPEPLAKVTLTNPTTGEPEEFVVKRHVSLPGYLEADKRAKSRLEALKIQKKLPVVIPADIVENYPEVFKDAVKRPNKDDYEVYLNDEKEVMFITSLEVSMADPELTWSQAVIWTRIAGPMTIRLMEQIDKINSEIALEEAKND